MDAYLETADLSSAFAEKGKIKFSASKKINLDLPEVVIRQIDLIATQIGVARQPLLKLWIHEKLKEEQAGL
jgi:hypothetical protein